MVLLLLSSLYREIQFHVQVNNILEQGANERTKGHPPLDRMFQDEFVNRGSSSVIAHRCYHGPLSAFLTQLSVRPSWTAQCASRIDRPHKRGSFDNSTGQGEKNQQYNHLDGESPNSNARMQKRERHEPDFQLVYLMSMATYLRDAYGFTLSDTKIVVLLSFTFLGLSCVLCSCDGSMVFGKN